MNRTLLPIFISSLLSCPLCAQSDNFNDGDDQGWTRLDPIAQAGFGTIANFAVVNGAYQINSTASPNEALLGPSRAGALRLDRTYNNEVYLSVDIKIPDPALRQAVGFMTMVQPEIGPGMTDGYSISWQPADNDLVINRIVDETPTRLVLGDLVALADFAGGQRLTVSIESGTISASLYNLSDLVNPIAQATTQDVGPEAYSSGITGLFLYSDVNNFTGNTSAIFDNYEANDGTIPQAPPAPTITRTPTGQIMVSIPASLLTTHDLQQSTTLNPDAVWTNISSDLLQSTSELSSFVTTPAPNSSQFFRLKEKPANP